MGRRKFRQEKRLGFPKNDCKVLQYFRHLCINKLTIREEKMKTERRSNKRLNEQIGAMFENEACQVLNISERGVLLQLNHPTMFLGIEKCIDFDLQLDGQWIRLRGKVEWIHDELALSRLGLSVQDAPSLYFDFLRKRLE